MTKRFLLATCLCVVSAASLVAPVAAAPTVSPPAAPIATPPPGAANTIQLVWLIYMTGIRFGTVGLKSSFAPGTYAAVSTLKTGGLVNVFYEARIDARAAGVIAGGGLRPQNYDANAKSKSKQRTQLAYTAAGIQLFADPAYNTERFPVTEEQKRGTLDPVSAMTFAISGLSVTAQRPCGDTLHVFDGARRYDVEFKFIQNENLPADEDGYTGPTVKCEVIYKQIAGFKPSVKQGDKTYPIYVWGATFETHGPGPMRRFVVPVRIMTETQFGTAKAIARHIQIDDEEKTK